MRNTLKYPLLFFSIMFNFSTYIAAQRVSGSITPSYGPIYRSYPRTKTVYHCCSPVSELCDLTNFDNRSECIQLCGGVNKCVPKEIEIAEY